MAEKVIIETFGSITKVEQPHTLESNILDNTFVLEASKPFPGYHGENLPSEPILHYIFNSKLRRASLNTWMKFAGIIADVIAVSLR